MSKREMIWLAGFLLTMVPTAIFAGQDPPPHRIKDYRVVSGWPQLPDRVRLGAVSAVATDSSDRVYVFHRGPQPILVFGREGQFLHSWGDDVVQTAHGLR